MSRLWGYDHFRRVVKFGFTGVLSTLAGLALITLGIEELGLEQNLANYIQAVLLVFIFFPAYYFFVFGKEGAPVGLSLGRWFIVKITAALAVEPAAFFLLAHFGAPYPGCFLFGSAVSGAYSYLTGHWAFGVRWTRVE